MGLAQTITHQGALVGAPIGGSSVSEVIRTNFTAAYAGRSVGAPSVVGATLGTPVVLPLGMARVRAAVFRVTGGRVVLLLTSPNGGADQALPIGDLWVHHNPFPGDEFTAIKVVGTGDLDYCLFGDVN